MPLTDPVIEERGCDVLHEGSLCHECVDNSYLIGGKCTSCWGPLVSGFILVLSVLMFSFFVFMVVSQGGRVGSCLIVIRFIQLTVSLVVICSITIHSSLLPIYGALRTIFLDIWKHLPLVCMNLAARNHPLEFYLSAIILALTCIFIWLLKPRDRFSKVESDHWTLEAVLIVILTLTPSLAFSGLGVFSCRPVDDVYVLEADSSPTIMQCFTKQWTTLMVVVLIVLLTIGLFLFNVFHVHNSKRKRQGKVSFAKLFGYTCFTSEIGFFGGTIVITGLLWMLPPGLPRLTIALITSNV
ncbi:hypothetical protein GEMRC1_003298 [Eukaryota sp. GEM-RC1]